MKFFSLLWPNFHFSRPHFCWFSFAFSLRLLHLWPFLALLAHSLCYHCTESAIALMSQCPGLATSITGFAGKRHETTQIGLTTNGCSLCSGELAGPGIFCMSCCIIPSGFSKLLLIYVIISQNIVLTFFSLSSFFNTYDSSASTTTSEQITLRFSVIGLNLSSKMQTHFY